MAEDGTKVEDPFRNHRRLPPKSKRPGDAAGDRQRPQWKGPVPPPRPSQTVHVIPPADEASPATVSKSTCPIESNAVRPPDSPAETQHRRQPDPSADRTTPDTWRGALQMGALSLVLLVYAFNIGTLQGSAQGFLDAFVNSGQGSSIATLVSHLVPCLLLLPVLALFYGILRTLAGLIGLRRHRPRKRPRSRRQKTPFDSFRAAAIAHGISPRVAWQGFQILQPHVPAGRSLSLRDRLEADLGLSPALVRSLRLSLMAKISRESDPAMRLEPAETVHAMLLSALQAPRRMSAPATPVPVPGDPFRRR